MRKRSITVAVCLLVLCGCSRQEATVPKETLPEKTFLIGLKPSENLFGELERYEPVASYLSRKTGIRIQLKVFPRYREIVDRFTAERLDGAFFGTYTYVQAHRRLGVEVLARPVSPDNTASYRGLILARKDSGIRNARGMKGKRFAFSAKWTIDGYLFPLEYLHEHGVEVPRNYLKEAYFAGTHEDVIRDLLAKKADAGGAKSTVYRRMAEADPRVESELVILAESDEMPNSALALRKGIDPADRNRLKEALLGMHLDPEGKEALAKFHALRFIETTNEEYEPVLRYLDRLAPHLTDPSTTDR